MYKRSEGFFKGVKDLKIYFQNWEPAEAKATLLITSGHGEHSESYVRLVESLKEESYSIYAWDLRGHGRSEGLRGYVENFSDYRQDLGIFISKLFENENIKNKPFFLLAHSLGGIVQLTYLIDQLNSESKFPIKAQVLSSPFLGVSLDVSSFKLMGAQVLKKFWPKTTLWNEINNEHLSSDPSVLQEYKHDVLRHNRISAEAYLGAVEAIKEIFDKGKELNLPSLIQMSDQDPVVSSEKIKLFYEELSSSNKELKIYPNRKHEIYNDLLREEVFEDLKSFLRKQL